MSDALLLSEAISACLGDGGRPKHVEERGGGGWFRSLPFGYGEASQNLEVGLTWS